MFSSINETLIGLNPIRNRKGKMENWAFDTDEPLIIRVNDVEITELIAKKYNVPYEKVHLHYDEDEWWGFYTIYAEVEKEDKYFTKGR